MTKALKAPKAAEPSTQHTASKARSLQTDRPSQCGAVSVYKLVQKAELRSSCCTQPHTHTSAPNAPRHAHMQSHAHDTCCRLMQRNAMQDKHKVACVLDAEHSQPQKALQPATAATRKMQAKWCAKGGHSGRCCCWLHAGGCRFSVSCCQGHCRHCWMLLMLLPKHVRQVLLAVASRTYSNCWCASYCRWCWHIRNHQRNRVSAVATSAAAC